MRMCAENRSAEEKAKGFTDVQKGKLMGWCGVTRWANMPQIWHRIEEAKTEDDLRVILEQEWSKNRGNLNVQFYDIYWVEDLLTAIRKVLFTKSARATYATSESCLSPLLLMPVTEERRLEIESEFQRRLAAGRNVTMADLKRA